MVLAIVVSDEGSTRGEEAASAGELALDIFFRQEIEQMVTVRDIEALSGQLARIRARTKPS